MSKQTKLCPVCKTNVATNNKALGILPCDPCLVRRRKANKLPDQVVEMVGDSIKTERKAFAKSIVQPFGSDGTFSDEYYQAHGTKGIAVTPQQVKNRKKVWSGVISDNLDITKSK